MQYDKVFLQSFIGKRVEPIREYINCNKSKKEIYTINIENKEYSIAEYSANNMWCSTKTGSKWGAGLINSDKDKTRAERIGRLGEIGFSKIFSVAVDLSFRHRGDEQDVIYQKQKIDIKTSSRKPTYNAGLIRAYTHSGKQIKLKHDFYVFAFIKEESRTKKTAIVSYVGGIKRKDITDCYIKPARLGSHTNYEIPYVDLQNIYDLCS